MNNQIPNAEKHLKNIEEFINHNLSLKYISTETTVEELLQFIKNVKEQYIPLLININQSEHKGMNCLTCGYSMSINDQTLEGFDKLFCVITQTEVSEEDYCKNYN